MNNPHGDNVDKTVGKVWICNKSVTIKRGFNRIVTNSHFLERFSEGQTKGMCSVHVRIVDEISGISGEKTGERIGRTMPGQKRMEKDVKKIEAAQ